MIDGAHRVCVAFHHILTSRVVCPHWAAVERTTGGARAGMIILAAVVSARVRANHISI